MFDHNSQPGDVREKIRGCLMFAAKDADRFDDLLPVVAELRKKFPGVCLDGPYLLDDERKVSLGVEVQGERKVITVPASDATMACSRRATW